MGRRGLSHVLLDTHTWVWTLSGDARLSTLAVNTIDDAETVSISAISFYEIGQKVRLGKWPEMEPHVLSLIELATQQGCRLLPVSPAISLASAMMEWPHRDPFDRMIGATALGEGLVLISADVVFDDFVSTPEWKGRIW